ncbi:hypothetical protein GZH46_01891, partial [Fragariocoptes setiger]
MTHDMAHHRAHRCQRQASSGLLLAVCNLYLICCGVVNVASAANNSVEQSGHKLVKRFAIASVLNPNAVVRPSGVSLFPGPRRSPPVSTSFSLSNSNGQYSASDFGNNNNVDYTPQASAIYYTDRVTSTSATASTDNDADDNDKQHLSRRQDDDDTDTDSYSPSLHSQPAAAPIGGSISAGTPYYRSVSSLGSSASGNSRRYAAQPVTAIGASSRALASQRQANIQPAYQGESIVAPSAAPVRSVAGDSSTASRDDVIMEQLRHLHPQSPERPSSRHYTHNINSNNNNHLRSNGNANSNDQPKQYERRLGYQAPPPITTSSRSTSYGDSDTSGVPSAGLSSYSSSSGSLSNDYSSSDNGGASNNADSLDSNDNDNGPNGSAVDSPGASSDGLSVDSSGDHRSAAPRSRYALDNTDHSYGAARANHKPQQQQSQAYQRQQPYQAGAAGVAQYGTGPTQVASQNLAPNNGDSASAPEDAAEQNEAASNNKPDKLALILENSKFDCAGKKDGYYADKSVQCQAFHYCVSGAKHSWMCPEGTVFHQVHLNCVPASQDICDQSERYHMVNDYLYKPMDSNGPNKTVRYHQRYYPDEFTYGLPVVASADGSDDSVAPASALQAPYPDQAYGPSGNQAPSGYTRSHSSSSSSSIDDDIANSDTNSGSPDNGSADDSSSANDADLPTAPRAYQHQQSSRPIASNGAYKPSSYSPPQSQQQHAQTQRAPPGVLHAHSRYNAAYGSSAPQSHAHHGHNHNHVSHHSHSHNPGDSEAAAQTYSDSTTYAARHTKPPALLISRPISQSPTNTINNNNQQVQPKAQRTATDSYAINPYAAALLTVSRPQQSTANNHNSLTQQPYRAGAAGRHSAYERLRLGGVPTLRDAYGSASESSINSNVQNYYQNAMNQHNSQSLRRALDPEKLGALAALASRIMPQIVRAQQAAAASTASTAATSATPSSASLTPAESSMEASIVAPTTAISPLQSTSSLTNNQSSSTSPTTVASLSSSSSS